MSYDYRKLKGRIIEKFGSQKNFAKAMGWSVRTTSLKMTGKIFWKQTEITKASGLLGIDSREVSDYFFTENVQIN